MLQELKEHFSYNPETGIFTNKKNRHNTKKGKKSGWTTKDGYKRLKYKYKTYGLHRLAWYFCYGYWPKEIDHIDQNKSNNKITNLREVLHETNSHNLPKRITNTSGIMGVSWNKQWNGGWIIRINSNGKRKYLGFTKDFFEACCIRKSAEIKLGYHKNHGKSII